jgi:hypothetical protein
MASVTLKIPADLLGRLETESGGPAVTLRRVAAFFLCSWGELSASQAARLAGMIYGEFLEAAARARVTLFPVHVEELKDEATRGFTLGRQRVAPHPPGEGGLG